MWWQELPALFGYIGLGCATDQGYMEEQENKQDLG